MDELLIEDKKYVSSKRAAKMTGYAKDYVGQLCREGRVPARLVGRSWYVLEAAIQDHRFGNVDSPQVTVSKPIVTEAKQDVLPPTWQAPKYESTAGRELPTVHRPEPKVIVTEKVQERLEDTTQNLQDAWQEWFSNFDKMPAPENVTPKVEAAVEPEPVKAVSEPEIPEVETEEVPVPLHTVYELPPEELLPRRINVREASSEERVMPIDEEEVDMARPSYSRRLVTTVVGVGVTLSVLFVILAILGTGMFDNSVISTSQVRILVGVSVYNK